MFKHIRLSTLRSWFLVAIALTTIMALVSLWFVINQLRVVDQSWTYFQAEQSEKALLENRIREQLGYNAMIHNLKNYVLRGNDTYYQAVQQNLGAVFGILNNYRVLVINETERAALDEIQQTIQQYDGALLAARQVKSQGYSVDTVDAEIYVNDEPALAALEVLRIEMRSVRSGTQVDNGSKSRALADLNAELGYGGLIHSFKNYVIRKRPEYFEEFLEHYEHSTKSINAYTEQGVTNAEKLALRDIQIMIEAYRTKLNEVRDLAERGFSSVEIDQAVKVDDAAAIRGLKILKAEIAYQIKQAHDQVDKSIHSIRIVLASIGLAFALFLAIAGFITYWVLTKKVIDPIQRITSAMRHLSDGDLDIVIHGTELDNEIGEMKRSVKFFQEALQHRLLTEQRLEHSNEELNSQLEDNLAYREQLQQQANKAIDLSDSLLKISEEAKLSAKKAAESADQVTSILEAVSDAIIVIDSKGIIEQFNPGAQQIFGYSLNEIIGQNVDTLMTKEIAEQHQSFIEQRNKGRVGRELRISGEQIARHRDGYEFPVEINLSMMRINDELKYIGVMRDISERKRWEAQIQRMAMTDPLTGLSNRTHFNTRLNEAVELSKRHGHLIGLMMIDLDKFKPVNDTYGHPVGDQLLKHISRLFKKRFREVDTIARLGGDEFAVILAGIDSIDNMADIAQEVIDTLSKPITISGHDIQIGCSIGICSYPLCADSIKSLVQNADDALYQAKADGRNCYRAAKPLVEPELDDDQKAANQSKH